MEGENRRIELQEEIDRLKLQIKEYEERNSIFEKILDRVDEAIYIYDDKTYLIYMNRAAEKVEGRKREDLIGKMEKEIWNTDEVRPVLEGEKLFRNKRMDYMTPNGRRVHITHNMEPYYGGNKIKGVFTITRDYTEITNMIMDVYELQNKIRNEGENRALNNGTRYILDDIIGEDELLRKCVRDAYKVARHELSVLIYGETGTGKELFAQGIHNASSNCEAPFIGLNCSAIPSNLVESLLFGTKQGAFTGALDTKGLIEQAGKGTLFLDEINSMPIDIQAKLLRVLQEKKYRRIGDTKDKDVKCRIISSTNVQPSKAVKSGRLRQDLYYRIAVSTITIPPLRDRISDIGLLIFYFINKYNDVFDTKIQSIDNDLLDACTNYHWPGNVRELEHMVKSALGLCDGHESVLTLDIFPNFIENNKISHDQNQPSKPIYWFSQEKIDLNKRLDEYESELIKNALLNNKGNVAATARQLSIHRSVLYNKMKRLNIDLDKLVEYVLE